MTARPTTPAPRPAPKPKPSGPWDNPTTIPVLPRYTPTGAGLTEVRVALARHDGCVDRQQSVALGMLQANTTMLTGHLTDHLDCDRSCEGLAGLVRSAGAISAGFDAAAAQSARRAA